jgi:hypothetical protein
MRKSIAIKLMVIITLLVICVTPAMASTPLADVTITITTAVSSVPTSGQFTAAGPAVQAGLVCPAGFSEDSLNRPSGYQSGGDFRLLVRKLFTCGDGSGTFTLQLEVKLMPEFGTTGNWSVLSGTGAYKNLHGAGTFVGTPIDATHIEDVLTGHLN